MIHDVTVECQYGLVITEEHKTQMKGNKSCGYVYMPPHDFLYLTSNDEYIKQLLKDALPLDEYNKLSKRGKTIIPPFLIIECGNLAEPAMKPNKPHISPLGKVLGHEGRHRAAACINDAVPQMPVFLIAAFHGQKEFQVKKHPGDPSKRYELRHVDKVDFPEYAIGQEIPTRRSLHLETWKAI